MFKQLAHVCIVSQDLAACEKFYCEVLGLSKEFNFDRNGELIGFYIAVGNTTFIEVFHTSEAQNFDRLPMKHICLEVDNIDDLITMLRGKGVEVTDKKLGADESWQCWLKDPDGIDLEIHQYTAKSSQLTGATCHVDW